MRALDAAIIGGGPAGMAAAMELSRRGLTRLMVFERNAMLGGILNQCVHTGFGLEYFDADLSGPEYVGRLEAGFNRLRIPVRLDSSVISLTASRELTVSSSRRGLETFSAGAVILATGCRERTRDNLEIPGQRPAGVYTAGQAQTLINLQGLRIGRNVVIQGSGDIGLIMARRLTLEGYSVLKVFERQPYLCGLIRNKVQCLDDFGIPLELNAQITQLSGRDRLSGVSVARFGKDGRPVPGAQSEYECDTVLFAVGLIPELELAKKAGVRLRGGFNPEVNRAFETSASGIFVCGNALHIHDLADNASKEAEEVARHVLEFLAKGEAARAADWSAEVPYASVEKNPAYSEEFFSAIGTTGRIVCVVCPKSCLLGENEWGCRLGRDFYQAEKSGKKRILTTTLPLRAAGGRPARLAVRSTEAMPFELIPEAMRMLKAASPRPAGSFSLRIGGVEIRFTRPAARGRPRPRNRCLWFPRF